MLDDAGKFTFTSYNTDNFVPDDTMFIKFVDYLNMNITNISITKLLNNVELTDTLKMELSNLQTIQNTNLEFNFDNVMESVFSAIKGINNTEFTMTEKMELIAILNQFIANQVISFTCSMELDITSYILYYLDHWDSELLSTLDSMTLNEMDYEVV